MIHFQTTIYLAHIFQIYQVMKILHPFIFLPCFFYQDPSMCIFNSPYMINVSSYHLSNLSKLIDHLIQPPHPSPTIYITQFIRLRTWKYLRLFSGVFLLSQTRESNTQSPQHSHQFLVSVWRLARKRSAREKTPSQLSVQKKFDSHSKF